MKQIIKDVLEDMSNGQVNLGSSAARELVSTTISAALKVKGTYTEYSKGENFRQRTQSQWVCSICGESTANVEYDYIGSNFNHLACELKTDGYNEESYKLADEIGDAHEGEWIYESPDGGKTVFRRPFGKYDPELKEEIDFETKEPTGRMFTDYPYGDDSD